MKIAYLLGLSFLFFSNFVYSQKNYFVPELVSSILSAEGKRYSDFVISGDSLYAIGEFGIKRYKISDKDKVIYQKTTDKNYEYRKRSIDAYGDYLYVTMRAYNAKTTPNGLLKIFDKKTFSTVGGFSFDSYPTDVLVYSHYLYVTGLSFFRIYDLDLDPTNPQIIFDYQPDTESQGFKLFEAESRLYAFVCNFMGGISIFDVTNPVKSFLVSRYLFDDGSTIPFVKNSISTTMDVVIDYPYAYSTLAIKKDYLGSSNDNRGILVWDISNPCDVKLLSGSLLKNYDNSNGIVYDVQPYCIEKYNEFIIVNNLDKGFSVFDVRCPESPEYYGTFSNDLSNIVCLKVTDDGYLFTGSDKESPNLSVYKITEDCNLLSNNVYNDSILIRTGIYNNFDIPIKFETSTDIVGFQFDMTLPDELSYVFEDDVPIVQLQSSNVVDIFGVSLLDCQTIRVVGASSSNSSLLIGDEYVLNVRVKSDGVSILDSLNIKYSNIQFSDINYNPIDTKRSFSYISTPYTRLGDANYDGYISVSDYSAILNYILGNNQNIAFQSADLNKDKSISVIDLSLLVDLVMSQDENDLKKSYAEYSSSSYIDASYESVSDGVLLSVNLNNYSDIDSYQFDVNIPDCYSVINESDCLSKSSLGNYRFEKISNNKYRFFYGSINKSIIKSNIGKIAQFYLLRDSLVSDSLISFSNIEISYRGVPEYLNDYSSIIKSQKYNEVSVAISDYIDDNMHNKIEVYPNPVVDNLHIIGVGDNPHYHLFTLGGRLLSHGFSSCVDFSKYERGVYLLKIGSRTFKVSKI